MCPASKTRKNVKLPADCIVYSLGSSKNFDFEVGVLKHLGCAVFTFDCTVGDASALAAAAGNIKFKPWCVGGRDEMKKISSDWGHGGEIKQYYTLRTIMRKLGHDHVDILKMDIERHEFAVIESLEASAAPGQIAFEVHLQNSYSMWGRPVSYAEWAGLWQKLVRLGYGVFYHEVNFVTSCCAEFALTRRAVR